MQADPWTDQPVGGTRRRAAVAAALLAIAALAGAFATLPAAAGGGEGAADGDAVAKQERVVELSVAAHDGGGDFWFTFEQAGDARNPTIQLPPGAHVVVNVENAGAVVHNFHVADDAVENCQAEPALSPGQCATALLNPGETATLEFDVPEDASGTFDYWCDPHLNQGMVGQFQVTEAAQPATAPAANATGPNITIVQPEANATIPLNDSTATVTVAVDASRFNLSDAFREGALPNPEEGHIHYFLAERGNVTEEVRANDTCFRLADGARTLQEATAANASAENAPENGTVNATHLLNSTGNWVNFENETLNVTGVPPGAYLLCVELVNNDHTRLTPPVTDTVNFTVGEGAAAAQPPANATNATNATNGTNGGEAAGDGGGDAGSPYVD